MDLKTAAKWANLMEAVLNFYDLINKEPTRSRKLFQENMDLIFLAVEKDQRDQLDRQVNGKG